MSFNVYWGDNLEKLAKQFYDKRQTGGDPLKPECVIIGSPVQEHWLKQYFLDCYRGSNQPVLANLEFKEIHPFVNDWVACAVEGIPIGKRNPGRHPFSRAGMQWRIWQKLQDQSFCGGHPALANYLNQEDRDLRSIRSWALAGQISKLFDDYINYRPTMLTEWEAGICSEEVRERYAWQPALWQSLVRNCTHLSYHRLFEKSSLEMLKDCPIRRTYKQLSVFHLSALPKNYLNFFKALGTFMTVNFYAFNPCADFWLEDSLSTLKEKKQMLPGDPEGFYYDPQQQLLCGFARGPQMLLRALCDAVDPHTPEDIFSDNPDDGSQLGQLRRELLNREINHAAGRPADQSLQIHICHSPRREVEILKDQLLKWFEENPGAQPRNVRVLVADMETYAPFIEAVFQPGRQDSPQASDRIPATPRMPAEDKPKPQASNRIPATLRMFAGGRPGPVAEAFLQILKLQDSNFSVVALQDLLELEPVQKKLNLDKSDFLSLTELVRQAGIRWGADSEQIRELYHQDIPDLAAVTWRHGLDRLLAGLALGREDFSDSEAAPVHIGHLQALTPCTGLEGSQASLLEVLCRFFDLIRYSCRELEQPRTVSQWRIFCEELMELFLASDEESFQELYDLHQVLRHLAEQAEFAGDPEISGRLLTRILTGMLDGSPGRNPSFQDNSVLFTPLQSMNITPADCVAVLGLNDGSYPRTDHHTAFDLIHLHPCYGDPSLRKEDRAAVLELICGTRKRLLLFYNGISISDNSEIPPSPVISELEKYLSPEKITTVRHKLHGFNGDYYRSGGEQKLFSYSQAGWEAAVAAAPEAKELQSPPAKEEAEDTPPDAGRTIVLTLNQLEKFFENPAKYFCQEELQTAIPDLNRDLLEDQEIIETDFLQNYNRNQLILERLLKQPELMENWEEGDRNELIGHLREESLLPPGPAGILEFDNSVQSLTEFLQNALPDGTPLTTALNNLTDRHLEVDFATRFGHVTLTGTVPICEKQHFSIYSRYASAKGKDFCRIHLRHLLGHAAGLSFSTHLFFKKKNPDPCPMSNQESARNHLLNILELYFSGLRHPLPFTPEMSLAYYEKEQEDEIQAIQAALGKWRSSSDFTSSDCDDPYYQTLWPDAGKGPLANQKFAQVALLFWGNKDSFDHGQQEAEA